MKTFYNKIIPTFLITALSTVLMSCATYTTYTYNKTSKIKDLTYITAFVNGESITYAYFLLEDSTIVPTPSNFNPCSPDSYIGKNLTYSYYTIVEQKLNPTDTQNTPGEYSNYICQKKYISSDGKYMIRIYTEKNPAIKIINVSADVYNRVQAGQKILKTDIAPYMKSN